MNQPILYGCYCYEFLQFEYYSLAQVKLLSGPQVGDWRGESETFTIRMNINPSYEITLLTSVILHDLLTSFNLGVYEFWTIW